MSAVKIDLLDDWKVEKTADRMVLSLVSLLVVELDVLMDDEKAEV